jgi:hypothetical protein
MSGSVEPAAEVEVEVEVRSNPERPAWQRWTTEAWAWAAVLLIGALFVLVGGGNLDLGPIEARLGLAAGEGFGPLGRAFGGWDPKTWPAQLAASVVWAWGEEGMPTAASVRWPAAIAGLAAGLILVRRMMSVLGLRAGLIVAVCWFGSIALIDRSAGAGLDLIAGLATVGALDRIFGRRSDWVAGLWAALAFLAAGWPPVTLIVMATIVIGRRESGLTAGLLVPPLAAAAAWSAWALSVMQAEPWAAALALPMTQKSAWAMAAGVIAMGLPWSPLAALAASRSVREGWTEAGRALVVGWLQVAGACLLVGTIVPGLAAAARVPALAGLAIVAAACCDRVCSTAVSTSARRWCLALALLLVAAWTALSLIGGVYLASAVPYYRTLSIVLIVLLMPIGTLAVRALAEGDPRRALLALALVAVGLKLGHWGYYVPEWNYRRSQGPWGRAIGQWVPPRWPVFTTHAWSPDLAFAIEHPVRQLAHPKLLKLQPSGPPSHVLLLESEFTHWPADAPPLVRVATFQDEFGGTRVLARTAGEFSWKVARKTREY